MKLTVNNCRVFLPQRIVDIDDKELSGVYLGENEVSSVFIDYGFDKVVQAQSESNLSSNNQDTPSVVVLQSEDDRSYVIYDKTKKILFCQSYIEEGFVNIIKAGKTRSFTAEEKSECVEFIKSSLGAKKSAPEMVEVDLDGTNYTYGFESKIELSDYFNASVTPYLRIPCESIVGLTERAFSMVILDISSGIVCKERFDVNKDEDLEYNKEKEPEKKVGLEAYFSSIKKTE